jgi:hypothetical protein
MVNQILSGALIVYEFPMVVINSMFVYPILHNVISLRSNAYDVVKSIVSVSAFSCIAFLFLFGGVKMSEGGMFENLSSIIGEAIFDYECVGSNVWLFICIILVPNLIIIIKTMTN